MNIALNDFLHTIGLLTICALWAVIGGAWIWHRAVYCPAARKRKMARIARQVQAELDSAAPAWWEQYLAG